MEIQLNTSSVSNLASVAEAAPILSAESLNVTESSPDLDALLSKLLMETNEAKLNAARSRLASALDQLTNLSEADKKTVGEMRDLAALQAQAETTLEAKTKELNSAAKELNSAEKSLDSAKDDLVSAENAASKAEMKLAQASKALEDYLGTAGTQDLSQIAALEADVASAEKALNAANAKVDAAGAKVASAEKRVDEASAAHSAARKAYDAAADEVNSLQTKFDQLLDSLDTSSLTALREAIRLDAGDVDHLHEEIEKDDEKHDLASVKAVEDVIADALDRLDGKMVDEVTNRHLDHI